MQHAAPTVGLKIERTEDGRRQRAEGMLRHEACVEGRQCVMSKDPDCDVQL